MTIDDKYAKLLHQAFVESKVCDGMPAPYPEEENADQIWLRLSDIERKAWRAAAMCAISEFRESVNSHILKLQLAIKID